MQPAIPIGSNLKNNGLQAFAARLISGTKYLLAENFISRQLREVFPDFPLPPIDMNHPKDAGKPLVQKIARTRDEREAAFRLVYRSYLRAGLCNENPLGIRICPYQLLPDSQMFVSLLKGEVVATVSLIPDSANGLPMESLYPDEVNAAREQGLHIGEISCLADRRKDQRRIIQNLCELTRVMTHFALQQKLDGLMLVSHPKHARFYKRFMGFELIGDIRTYRNVCDKLAEPLYFDFSSQRKAQVQALKRVLGESMPAEELEPSQMNDTDRVYFADIRRSLEQATPPRTPSMPALNLPQPTVNPCR